MSIEWSHLWFSQNELKNNNFNPELNKFLENNEISKEEADVLSDMFEENKAGVILVSKNNLKKLREIIWSNSKTNYITSKDKQKIKNISNNKEFKKEKKDKFIESNHIRLDWTLENVTKIRLDQIVWPSEKIKFSIKLTNNSLYPNYMDWNEYNVIWWKDIRSWKQTYIFNEWPRKWNRVMISNWDKLWEYKENPKKWDNKTENDNISEKINISERNKTFIEKLNLPENYKKIAYEFASKLRNNEVLTKNTPIALVDWSKKEMLYTVNWKKIIVPILVWKNWLTSWWYIPNDRKTPVGKIHRFDPSISKIAKSVNWDASNSWHSKTVKSASLQSDTSNAFGWRYFHWVAQYRIDWRFKWMWTWWCVWVDVNTIRQMYYDVKKNWKWYWYVG